jgi:protocatechuate 3,4-dioxygenase beta subunit
MIALAFRARELRLPAMPVLRLGIAAFALVALPAVAWPDDPSPAPPMSREGAFAVPADPQDYVKYIAVTGHAVDAAGKPIQDAAIYLASYRPGYKLLAEARTDAVGRYKFDRTLLPIETTEAAGKKESGEFEVFGLADGYAIAWRTRRIYYPLGKPDQPDREAEDGGPLRFGPHDPIALDLKFVRPHPIHGRIVDDEGRPIAGVEVNVRYCDTQWEKPEYDSSGFEGMLRAFNQSDIIPREVKIQTTDADGRFAFDRLPPDFRWHLWVRGPEIPNRRVWMVSRAGEHLQRDDQTAYLTEANLIIERTVKVPVRIVHGDNGEPARDVLVEFEGESPDDGWSAGYTDDDGEVTLNPPPGKFRVHISPAYRTPYWVTDRATTTVERQGEQPLRVFQLDPAATVEVDVRDVDTDAPVAGVRLWRELLDREPDLGEAPSGEHAYRSIERKTRISHINRIVSNEQGLLRTFFKPGSYRIKADSTELPVGYVPVDTNGRTYDLRSGEPTRITLYMRKTSANR